MSHIPKPPDFAAKISESLPCFRPPLVFPCFQDKIQRMRCPNRQTHPASIPLSLGSCSSTLAIRAVYCVFPQDVLSRLPAIAPPPLGTCHSSRPTPLAPLLQDLPLSSQHWQLPLPPLCCWGSRSQGTDLIPPHPEQRSWLAAGVSIKGQ